MLKKKSTFTGLERNDVKKGDDVKKVKHRLFESFKNFQEKSVFFMFYLFLRKLT